MNTRPTVIFAMISIIILFPVLSLASASVQETAIEDGAKFTARKDGKNSYTDADASLLSSRYYGALSPEGETDLILDQVQDLIYSGTLSQKTGTYLQVMLKAVKNKFDQGNDSTAIDQLRVFIHLVNTFVLEGQLSKEDGQKLIENARSLIEALLV